MSSKIKDIHFIKLVLPITLLLLISLLISAAASTTAPNFPGTVPCNPASDTNWSAGTSSVADIQTAFNTGRAGDCASLPALSMPSQSTWNAMTDGEKALYLINSERQARGIHTLHGVETNVTSIAQGYANYLMTNDLWGHCENGCPDDRLNANPTIGPCQDFIPYAENIAAFMQSYGTVPLPIERSVYGWLYDDSSSSWGHRYALLYYPYTDNSGPAGKEGFMGIGKASGSWGGWPSATVIVYNTFDPCSSWVYTDTPAVSKLVISLIIRLKP